MSSWKPAIPSCDPNFGCRLLPESLVVCLVSKLWCVTFAVSIYIWCRAAQYQYFLIDSISIILLASIILIAFININITINYLQEGLSISIPYQLFKKFPFQFQYQYILSISPYTIVKITNFLSISHSYQYQYWCLISK